MAHPEQETGGGHPVKQGQGQAGDGRQGGQPAERGADVELRADVIADEAVELGDVEDERGDREHDAEGQTTMKATAARRRHPEGADSVA